MKNKVIITVVILGVILFLIFQQYLIFNKSPDIDDNILKEIKILNKKLDELSNKKDSVKTIIVQLDNNLKTNNERHEEVVNSILIANDSINGVFIDNYIKQYIEKITRE